MDYNIEYFILYLFVSACTMLYFMKILLTDHFLGIKKEKTFFLENEMNEHYLVNAMTILFDDTFLIFYIRNNRFCLLIPNRLTLKNKKVS